MSRDAKHWKYQASLRFAPHVGPHKTWLQADSSVHVPAIPLVHFFGNAGTTTVPGRSVSWHHKLQSNLSKGQIPISSYDFRRPKSRMEHTCKTSGAFESKNSLPADFGHGRGASHELLPSHSRSKSTLPLFALKLLKAGLGISLSQVATYHESNARMLLTSAAWTRHSNGLSPSYSFGAFHSKQWGWKGLALACTRTPGNANMPSHFCCK